MVAILLLTIFTGSRLNVLLLLEYRDLDLYIERDRNTDKQVYKLGVTLIKIKSRQKQKRL